MSLINKMLQDLDARGSAPGQAGPADLRPSPLRGRELPLRAAAIVGCFVVLLALAGVLGWRHFAPSPKMAAPAAAPPAATVRPAVTAQATAPSATIPSATTPPAAAPQVAASAPVSAPALAPVPAPASAPAPAALAAPVTPVAVVAAPAAVPAPAIAVPAAKLHEHPRMQPPAKSAAIASKLDNKGVSAGKAAATSAPSPLPISANGAAAPASPQRAENEYRRALDALQEGRLGEALAGLQRTLQIDPRHQAARETLVRLLLEANRPDEAVRELDQGLVFDPKQPTQAMLLARLQLEKGGPAVDTLMRTLPYAADNGDYQAFLAGVLQRAQRNKESAEHYQVALRKAPQNGVWWMGLGIALQADKRLPEARDAFEHAKATANLSPELQTFVERKLQQLAH
jgi:MSHA biogenesis protein MshN